jgi:hypothetical protein
MPDRKPPMRGVHYVLLVFGVAAFVTGQATLTAGFARTGSATLGQGAEALRSAGLEQNDRGLPGDRLNCVRGGRPAPFPAHAALAGCPRLHPDVSRPGPDGRHDLAMPGEPGARRTYLLATATLARRSMLTRISNPRIYQRATPSWSLQAYDVRPWPDLPDAERARSASGRLASRHCHDATSREEQIVTASLSGS